MIDFEVARQASDDYRRWLAAGMAETEAWKRLRLELPDANVFERRRIAARARQMRDIIHQILLGNPPNRINLLYPLPPSTEAARPYEVEIVAQVPVIVAGQETFRTVIVPNPNNTLWSDWDESLDDAAEDLNADYDSAATPDYTATVVR